MAMARELVTGQRIGEGADHTWRRIQERNDTFRQREARRVEPEIVRPAEEGIIFPAGPPLPAAAEQLALFDASLASASGPKPTTRRRAATVSAPRGQLALF